MSQREAMERGLALLEAAMKKKWLWAGIVLGVETASVCIIDEAGDVLHEGVCPAATKSVRHELACFRRTRFASVALEAGIGGHVARGLRSLGYPIELYEARKLSKFLRVRRNKTDAGDARGIAEAGRIGASIVSKVYLKSIDSQALQSCLAIRRHLVRQRVAAVNLLGRQIEVFGGRLRCKSLGIGLRRAVDYEIQTLFRCGSEPLAAQLRYLADHCERLMDYQRAIDRELERVARDNEVCRRFMEIPGVGPFCALTFFAAVDDPHRFSRSSDIGSYFGLAPSIHESGMTSKRARITKMGNKNVRSLLVHAAAKYILHSSPNCTLRNWALLIEKRRGRLPSRVALARRLAVVMLAIWKSGDHFKPPELLPHAE
jgi:transposase